MSDATQALWRAVFAHDLTGARKALFQGADLLDERRAAPGSVAAVDRPFVHVLLGDLDLRSGRWTVDLPMLELMLDFGAPLVLPDDRSAVTLATVSCATNAHEAVDRLARRGAVIYPEMLSAVLLTIDAQFDVHKATAAQPDRLPMLDTLWGYLSPADRSSIVKHGSAFLARAGGEHGRAAVWLAAQRPAASLGVALKAAEPVSLGSNVVAFRPRPRS